MFMVLSGMQETPFVFPSYSLQILRAYDGSNSSRLHTFIKLCSRFMFIILYARVNERAKNKTGGADMKRRIALLIAVILIASVSLGAYAERGGGPGGPGGSGGPGGGPGMRESDVAGTGNSVNSNGKILVSNNQITADNDLAAFVTTESGSVTIEGLTYTSGDYSDTIISATGSCVAVNDANISLAVADAISGSEQAGTALYTDSGMSVIADSVISVDGAGRYTVAATGTATMIVRDSVIKAGGDNGANGNTSTVSEPASNAGLLISGTSRANFSVGQTHTFYYDSLCVADGWAALSTDSATGSGLEFVAADTEAVALHGGYGIYSDTNCRDYLYGCTLVSAEIGGIISNNGSIVMDSSDSASDAATQDGYSALAYAEEGYTSDAGRSKVIAGRNCFQLHSPDMMGEGTSDYTAQLSLSHTDLITDDTMNQDSYLFTSSVDSETYTVQADTDYAEKYSAAVGAYVDYVRGAAILVKSTSADIDLNDVTVTSSDGVALLTALNSDSMSRYLKKDVGNGVSVSVENSTIDGDFVHDDYQRDMSVTLTASTLNGAVSYSTAEEWNARWAEYAADENACWVNLNASTYITSTHETTLTLTEGSVWNVTGASRLTRLSVSADSTVNGVISAEQTETQADGTIIYTNVTVICE